jgi:protein TonB
LALIDIGGISCITQRFSDTENCWQPGGYNGTMTAGLRLFQSKLPEWQHSGRYLLIALGLHVIVLFYPLTMAIDQQETAPPVPVTITLQEKVSAPQVMPLAPAEPVRKQTSHPREKSAPAPRPVIAMTPEQVSPAATFTVPAPIVAPAVAPPAAAPVSSPAPATVTAARFDAAYLHNPHPDYPPIARRLGEEGKVLLKVRVTADGRAAAIDVEKSSSSNRLDDAAVRSVTRWRFVPAKRGDEAIEATVIVPIIFRLDD